MKTITNDAIAFTAHVAAVHRETPLTYTRDTMGDVVKATQAGTAETMDIIEPASGDTYRGLPCPPGIRPGAYITVTIQTLSNGPPNVLEVSAWQRQIGKSETKVPPPHPESARGFSGEIEWFE